MAIIQTTLANQAELSGIDVTEVTEFKIAESAHAFRIIADNLYANKIRAVVRETISNANDSHIAAGVDRPVQIHIPTTFEPWYAVKDYGTGMSPETINFVFARVFESTKNKSNDQTGGLGLGAKAPFAYNSNQFTITSTFNGMTYIFAAFINDSGKPALVQMAKFETTDTNGVEIKLAVLNGDINTFESEIRQVIRWYKNTPVDADGNIIRPRALQYTMITDSTGFGVIGSIVVMGNVEYPVDVPDALLDQFSPDQRNIILNRGMVYFANIGDVDFQASREQLAYTKKTIDFFKKNIDEAISIAQSKLDQIVNGPNVYENVENFAKWLGGPFSDLSIKLRHQYTKTLNSKLDITAIAKQYNVSLTKFTRAKYNGTIAQKAHPMDEMFNGMHRCYHLNYFDNIQVIVNDMKRSQLNRIAKANYKNSFWYMQPIEFGKPADFAAVLNLLYMPPKIEYVTTDYPVESKAKSDSTEQVLASSYCKYARQITWKQVKLNLNVTEPTYYVEMSNYDPTGFPNINDLNTLIKCMIDHFKLPNLVVYGIRKHSIEKVKNAPNWIELKEFVADHLMSLSVDAVNLVGLVHGDRYDSLNDNAIKAALPADHAIRNFINGLSSKSTASRPAIGIIKMYAPKSSLAKKIDKLVKAEEQIRSKYTPLFWLSTNTPVSVKIDLINLIDKA